MLKQIERHSDKMVVIGNGPSLNSTMEKYWDAILEYDTMVVNEFGATDFYEKTKPGIYVFSDPVYYTLPYDLSDSLLSLFDVIIKKTCWPLRIIFPLSAEGSKSVDILLQNKFITIDFFNDKCKELEGKKAFEAWDRNLVAPPSQTVLNTCLYLSLFWNYKETYLIGADTSFLEDIRVDQQTNEIYLMNSHFYQNDRVYTDKFYSADKGVKMSGWTLHDLIFAFGNMFKSYAQLKEYADYKGLKIYNASEYSWINVFERKKIK